MALNKSKKIEALTTHCLVYSLCFLWMGWKFALLTFWLHWITDYITSRVTSKLWFIRLIEPHGVNNKGEMLFYGASNMTKRHWFFVAIGVDQLIHYACLIFAQEFVKWA